MDKPVAYTRFLSMLYCPITSVRIAWALLNAGSGLKGSEKPLLRRLVQPIVPKSPGSVAVGSFGFCGARTKHGRLSCSCGLAQMVAPSFCTR